MEYKTKKFIITKKKMDINWIIDNLKSKIKSIKSIIRKVWKSLDFYFDISGIIITPYIKNIYIISITIKKKTYSLLSIHKLGISNIILNIFFVIEIDINKIIEGVKKCLSIVTNVVIKNAKKFLK